MFSEIGGLSSSTIQFLSYDRFMKILRFLVPGELKYTTRRVWRKSSAMAHRELGGYFQACNSLVLDLGCLFNSYIQNFNENSRSIYKCSGNLTLDEILSKSKSRKNVIRQYNGSKKDKIGCLWHLLCDANTNFCVKTQLRVTKQFLDPEVYKISGLCLFFLNEFRGTFVLVTQDNYFNSFNLCNIFTDLGIYVLGTLRKLIIQRQFSDHDQGIKVYIDNKNSKNHNLKCFSASEYDHPTRGRVHVIIYNSPGRNSVLFITNSNSVLGKSTIEISPDYRRFLGGHYSRNFDSKYDRPYVAKMYSTLMGTVDTFDVYVHKYNLRYIILKNNLGWILKPVLSIIDYQLLNTFMVYREMHDSPDCDYRKFLLKIARGFCRRSVKPPMAPLRVRNLSFSRDNCMLCKELNPKKDSRTCKSCFKCGNGSCTQHSKIICLSCARQ